MTLMSSMALYLLKVDLWLPIGIKQYVSNYTWKFLNFDEKKKHGETQDYKICIPNISSRT